MDRARGRGRASWPCRSSLASGGHQLCLLRIFRDLRAGRQTFGQVDVARAWMVGQPGCDGDACTQIDLIGVASIVMAPKPTAARNQAGGRAVIMRWFRDFGNFSQPW